MSALVFDRYTQEALDAQYNNQLACPGFRDTLAQGRALSLAAAHLPGARDVEWGPHPLERVDIYGPEAPANAALPVLLFIHGGAWLAQEKEDSAFGAQAFADHGCMWVALGFPDAADVPFAEMVASVRRGIAWVVRHIAAHGGDPQRLVLAGHSSGTHLVSQALTHDWSQENWTEERGTQEIGTEERGTHESGPQDALTAIPFHGAVMVSGLCDLEPVRRSYRNVRLNLDAEHVKTYSLAHSEPTVRVPVVVAVAEKDTDEFRRQAHAMADRLRDFDMLAAFDVVPDRHHFDVILDLADPTSKLFRDTLALLKPGESGEDDTGEDRTGEDGTSPLSAGPRSTTHHNTVKPSA